jgi:hypothetical protein
VTPFLTGQIVFLQSTLILALAYVHLSAFLLYKSKELVSMNECEVFR